MEFDERVFAVTFGTGFHGKGKRNATSRLAQPGEVFAMGLSTDEEWIRQFGALRAIKPTWCCSTSACPTATARSERSTPAPTTNRSGWR
ncbi:hypothetical protein ACFYOT_27665 [Saccharothrix saharensis]|uniref:hypothetical protein n=1 Tax=Saccharothrix saharensis TaxID=571190 RepID=UPI003691850C